MDSSKTPLRGQEPTNQAAEDDQIVDLSFSDDELIDEPPPEEQPFSSLKTEEQVIERPRVERQVIERQPVAGRVEGPRTGQAGLSPRQPLSGRPCWQCGWLMPQGASFCSHCGAPLGSLQVRTPAPMPAFPARGAPAGPPGKSRKKGRKPLWLGLVAIMILISLALGMYTQAFGKLQILRKLTGTLTGSTQQPTSATSTPNPTTTPLTPTVTVRSTPVTPRIITGGALILLNPSVVRQGGSMGVTGSGFDPRTMVDLTLKQRATDVGQPVGSFKTDKYGNFYANLTVPQALISGTFFVEAHERGSNKVSQTAGVIAGGVPQVKLSDQVGQPGDLITVSASGFSPGEAVKVYWDTTAGQPFATLQADGGGKIGQATLEVPFGAVGINTFLFVGAKTQLMVAATFDLLNLYPTVKLSNYAIRAANQVSFSGKGFGPNEQVLVYLNNMNGQPIEVLQANQHGTFTNAGSFLVPFTLKGRQAFIFLGEESRASVAVSWSVLPYMPSAQTSTYGGLPGTTVTFYASGFARNEIVHVYVGGTQGGGGKLVSCFRTDGRGDAVSVGSYIIPGDAQGKLSFKLVGMQSEGVAIATMSIEAPPAPVQVPPQPAFTCPLDNATS
ncbi:MAG TPA: zinc ribbon domain-containing protein [Ktedonobacteraceae bacterium]|nr:zinc ribbon domain-containing protein [Ktedonobacteraceae bacterium]